MITIEFGALMTIVAGLDVGGAHLKVALTQHGRPISVAQFLCPLWQGLDKLDSALDAARPMTSQADVVAVTMTGELSDLFPDRKTGVDALVTRIAKDFGVDARFWMGARGFGDAAEAKSRFDDVGSTNFLATAVAIARRLDDALLIDFGSTTTDITPILRGTHKARGLIDRDRQSTGELIYTGFTRTAVMGVASRAPLKGVWVTLAREHLATMADVRRVIGEDLADVDLHATADGKGKSQTESVARLARMLGTDGTFGDLADWRNVAEWLRDEQLSSIAAGAYQTLSATTLPREAPVVTAGVGWRDAGAVAERLGRRWLSFGDLMEAPTSCRDAATHAAPAVAVALLTQERKLPTS